MSPKTNPILFRRPKNVQNVSYLQQIYQRGLFPYALNEQEIITEYSITFLQQFGFHLHSLKVAKSFTGKCFILIRFFWCFDGILQDPLPKLNFISLEKAFAFGLSKMLNLTQMSISFFDILKSKSLKSTGLPIRTLINWRFFTSQEIEKSIELLIKQKGGASFLAFFISFKLSNLRSKLNKKSQALLLNCIKIIVLHIKKSTPFNFRGIRIIIKGRINGISRTKKWRMLFGSLSLQRIHQEVEYSYMPAFTVFGSFGVKVWINYGLFL